MILVISNIANEAAPVLVDMFPTGAAFLITASEFHQQVKAEISVNDFLSSALIIHDKKITPKEITGVITTIPHFFPQEFYFMDPADRIYVCAEMNAFFIYFLSQLSCKKLNPSSQRALTGLSMHKIELLKSLHELNIPLQAVHLKNSSYVHSDKNANMKPIKATIIDNLVVPGELPAKITGYMRLISESFSLPYVSAAFISPDEKNYFLADIITVPGIHEDTHRKAIVNYFSNQV